MAWCNSLGYATPFEVSQERATLFAAGPEKIPGHHRILTTDFRFRRRFKVVEYNDLSGVVRPIQVSSTTPHPPRLEKQKNHS